ncbi:MAG: ECF RNA polymerase sigma factor SigE [Chloroflexi bacterium]|nr:ECF RNA polymerase sigma factor SigE [Chloroflexota bacterium]
METADLIAQALEGDLESFNQIVLEYQDMVYYQAYRVMGEPDAAEDATQEAFISAYQKLHTYRGGSFKSWLLRIVTNACYDELRRRQRQPVAPLNPHDDAGDELESPAWLEDPAEKPDQRVERFELSQAIQDCLNELDAKFRSVVVLVDIQGLDYQTTAEVVERPLGTIKSRLARARRSLQECLQGFGELLPPDLRLEGEELL